MSTQTNTNYTVRVVGRIWQGTKATHSYPSFMLPTAEEVRTLAVDFQTIDDYEVVKHTSSYTQTPKGFKQESENEIVKDWADESSEDAWHESQMA